MDGSRITLPTTGLVPARPLLPGRAQIVAGLVLAATAPPFYGGGRPPDLSISPDPCFAHIVHSGPTAPFPHLFRNSNPAYLYLLALSSVGHDLLSPMDIIKLLSVAGSLFLTYAVADLLKT